jgi:hypothetical protein
LRLEGWFRGGWFGLSFDVDVWEPVNTATALA